ncbi:sporulation protein YtxC [Syntrophomonas erecta]
MNYEFEITTISDSLPIMEVQERFQWIRQQGYHISIHEDKRPDLGIDMLFLALAGSKPGLVFRDEDINHIFKHQLAELLAEHILNHWEARLIQKEIQRSCRNITAGEKSIIFNKASQFLRRSNDNESLNLLMNYGRKNRICHKAFEHINHNSRITVEGFINFRLPDYLTEVRFAVEMAVEELINEKEYNDFITLLRYFVDTQIPKIYEVNIMMGNEGDFYLWDGNGIEIEEKYMSYYLDDLLLNEINFDDILISILITIAPRRIILHNVLEIMTSTAVETIKKVFKEKITICNGCERCRPYAKDTRHH